MNRYTFEVTSGQFCVEALVQEIGDDLLVALWGGSRPHVGAVAMAVPRPSLKDPDRWSATSSTYTFVGHKEDAVVKEVAEALAGALRRNVVVTAGMHWDDLSAEGIATVLSLSRQLLAKIREAVDTPAEARALVGK